MSDIIPVVPRAQRLEAFQIVLGETTASDIRGFAGDAVNVGHLDGDERDIRWVSVLTPRGHVELADGDWIVRDETGRVVDALGPRFVELYSPANADAAATLRARDVNDPRNIAATRIARAFSDSLRETGA